MIRRTFMVLATSVAFLGLGGAAFAQETIKIGASAPKTGPLAAGATVSHWPNVQLWVHEVNERGGLQVGDQQMKIELVEYDDRTSAETAVQNIQRLATVDNVDFIVTPYSTGLNVATAPIIARYGYPHITTSAITDGVEEFAGRSKPVAQNVHILSDQAGDLARRAHDRLAAHVATRRLTRRHAFPAAVLKAAESQPAQKPRSVHGKVGHNSAGYDLDSEAAKPRVDYLDLAARAAAIQARHVAEHRKTLTAFTFSPQPVVTLEASVPPETKSPKKRKKHKEA